MTLASSKFGNLPFIGLDHLDSVVQSTIFETILSEHHLVALTKLKEILSTRLCHLIIVLRVLFWLLYASKSTSFKLVNFHSTLDVLVD